MTISLHTWLMVVKPCLQLLKVVLLWEEDFASGVLGITAGNFVNIGKNMAEEVLFEVDNHLLVAKPSLQVQQ